MKLHFVRHAQSLANADESLYHSMADHKIPLSPKGEKQLEPLVQDIKGLVTNSKVKILYSPYMRAVQTAEAIKKGLDLKDKHFKEEPLLAEQRFFSSYKLMGSDQEDYNSDIKHEYGFFWYKEGEGESEQDVYTRTRLFLTDVRLGVYGTKKDLVIVCHGVFIKMIRKILEGRSLDNLQEVTYIPNASVVSFDFKLKGKYV